MTTFELYMIGAGLGFIGGMIFQWSIGGENEHR